MTTIAAPADRDRPASAPGSPGLTQRLGRRLRAAVGTVTHRSRGDRLMLAGHAVDVLVRLAVLAAAWRCLGVAGDWHPAAWVGVGVVGGWLAGQVPVYVTTYLVWRRRLMRRVEADLDARWPDRHR